MSDTTKIEWAHATFNPWIGCTKVSPGCAHCYAEHSAPTRVARKRGVELWGNGKPRRRTVDWTKPLRWNRDFNVERSTLNVQRSTAERPRIFPSLCDWLDDEVPVEWLADFLKLIHDTPHLDWLLLTKRPGNWEKRLRAAQDWLIKNDGVGMAFWLQIWLAAMNQAGPLAARPPVNVWVGASVEDQARADKRIPELLRIPARVRFLSVEPLLGPVDLDSVQIKVADGFFGSPLQWHHRGKCHADEGIAYPVVDWVIVGGESGPGARACNVEWVRSVVRQCAAAGVPCFVKQLGANVTIRHKFGVDVRIGLDHPKGGDPSEWPDDLRVREFPTSNIEH